MMNTYSTNQNRNLSNGAYHGSGDCTGLEAQEYNTNHSHRGTAVIINNMEFDPKTKQMARSGAKNDSDNLEATFQLLGFNVKSFSNLTTTEMLSVLHKESQENHRNNDCFVCAISSHGDEDMVKKSRWSSKTDISDVIYATDGILYVRVLTDLFKDAASPTLAGKPKLFFIQACRGGGLSETAEVEADGDDEDKMDWGGHSIITHEMPVYQDFLLAYSAPPGFFSFRRGVGSWFITALCNVLQTCHKDMDILSMLTRVNHQVAYEYESNTPGSSLEKRRTHRRRIVPWIVSQLRKDLYLRPKTPENERITFV